MSLQRVPWLLAMVLKIPFETPNPGRGEMTNPDWFLENVKQPVSWEFVSDPLDPKGHADPLYVVGYHLIVRNPKTGMIYVNPQPQYDHAEEDDLIGFRTESVSPQDRYFIRNARFAKQIIQWLKDSDKDDLIGKGRLLDLGMGTGLLLCAFRDDQNWPQDQLFGVDVAPAFVDTAKREFGFENQVQVGSIENRELYEQGSFDVIVLAQTIEHLPDPKGILENIRYWLSEGGVLILMDVPNSGGLAAVGQRQRWRQFVFEEHRWHFNHETLNELLKAVGFDPVRAQNMVEGPYLTPGELPWDDIGYIGRRFGINDVENLERLKILIFQAEQKWSQEYNLSYHLPNGLREASSAKEFEEWWNRKINHSPLLGNDVSFIAVNPKGDPKTDSAQLINPGGIDLNSDYLSLQTDRAMLQSSPVPGDSFINNLEIDGLVPFISEIRQISDLEALINLN